MELIGPKRLTPFVRLERGGIQEDGITKDFRPKVARVEAEPAPVAVPKEVLSVQDSVTVSPTESLVFPENPASPVAPSESPTPIAPGLLMPPARR